MVATASAGPVRAEGAEPLKVVATFSILADLARQVGGAHVAVTSLVGPDSDAHSYAPAPADARRIAEADIVIVNGLGFDGWLDRLVKVSAAKAPVVVAARGVRTIAGDDGHGHGHAHDVDPHAWQSVANVRVYVANIRDGLAKADPARAKVYAGNAEAYIRQLDALDGEMRATLAALPPERRRIITSHDAFGYLAEAYGLVVLAAQGVSTESEASPKGIASLIRQIRRERVPAVFVESIADPRLMEQVARESGARLGGRLYSDALSAPGGPASTYLDLMRANLRTIAEALKG
ncbi:MULTISPECIES: metal ABC transporter substrate-binding protein [Methylobacterium]|nr:MULTISPECIES: metal ABC transporter substrate-binding protein [Methylobacterium]PIU04521.1 MAG: ABC transporter substrate-binding protein [Methylobacterium sp. CG09_land_8_20_14_0_10_71_15]PIU12770.1 MAG: ABC transporter substrate-binding protein [Methylobacterium sp. CG08_land_8_20_14_0_20_71_15]